MSQFRCTDCYRLNDLGQIARFKCSALGWSLDITGEHRQPACKCRKGCHAGAKSWATAIRQGRAA